MRLKTQNGKWGLALSTALLATQGMAHAAPASPDKLPTRKSGLWQVKVRSDDLVLHRQGQVQQGPQTVQMCTSTEVEPVMLFAIVPAQEQEDEEDDRQRDARDGDRVGQLPRDRHQSRPVSPQASSSPSLSTTGSPSYWASIGSRA